LEPQKAGEDGSQNGTFAKKNQISSDNVRFGRDIFGIHSELTLSSLPHLPFFFQCVTARISRKCLLHAVARAGAESRNEKHGSKQP